MAKLSPRQQQIVKAMIDGKNQKQIARDYGMSWPTVREHLRRARAKTESRSTLDLVIRVHDAVSSK